MLHFPHHAVPTASHLSSAQHLCPAAALPCPAASTSPRRLYPATASPRRLHLVSPPPPCRRLTPARRLRPASASPRPCLPATTSTSPRHLRPADRRLALPRHLCLAAALPWPAPPPGLRLALPTPAGHHLPILPLLARWSR
ncbi:hypothetical protein GUJ93_ZPchr0001g31544 [Zizania palustris]|uniref:Uncharacterized protein n=1 Tax=Zizania palustris TaxID=103762 RepID=A0A8J5VLU7_ZIZPA|nr:hypothetical protein GUJ93_ZPchr0001g31544 [Zizania palustris]